MDGSEVDGCFETIDPAYRSGNDELNSEFIMLTVGSVWKGIYEFVCTGSSLRIDDPLRFISVNYIGKSFFEKNCHFNMI